MKNKPYIALVKDRYFGYMVCYYDKNPYTTLEDGSHWFQANSMQVFFMSAYREFLRFPQIYGE